MLQLNIQLCFIFNFISKNCSVPAPFQCRKIPQFLTERYDYASSCINSVLHAKPLSRCLEAANYN